MVIPVSWNLAGSWKFPLTDLQWHARWWGLLWRGAQALWIQEFGFWRGEISSTRLLEQARKYTLYLSRMKYSCRVEQRQVN